MRRHTGAPASLPAFFLPLLSKRISKIDPPIRQSAVGCRTLFVFERVRV
jgi:hypothetical protein